MRIGYLYDFQAYPPKGGNHRHAYELTQGFLKQGHIVSVVDDPTMPGVANYNSEVLDLKRFIENIDVLYVRIDARFTRDWSVLTICAGFINSLPMVWEINSPANEAMAFSWLGGKTATFYMKKEGLFRRLRRLIHSLRKLPGILAEESHRKRLARKVSSAICVSKALSKYATGTLKIKSVVVLPNGGPLISEVEIESRRQKRKRKEFTVLYSGSAMYPWQGLDYLSETIAIALHKAPEILFVLAVNQRSPILPASKNVVVLEGLNREDILDAICSADVCVALHPEYYWSKYGFHGSPMKLFEYMGCMAPTVSSDIGQMRDLIRDGVDGLLCKNEPLNILTKLIYLRDNPERAKSIGRKGWERVQLELNWQHNVSETLKIFDQSIR